MLDETSGAESSVLSKTNQFKSRPPPLQNNFNWLIKANNSLHPSIIPHRSSISYHPVLYRLDEGPPPPLSYLLAPILQYSIRPLECTIKGSWRVSLVLPRFPFAVSLRPISPLGCWWSSLCFPLLCLLVQIINTSWIAWINIVFDRQIMWKIQRQAKIKAILERINWPL